MSYGMQGNKIPKGYKYGQIQQYTPEQMNLHGSLYKHLEPGSYLSRLAGGEEGIFDELEAPAFRQFSGLQGNIASRFSGQGGLGARKSSGFQNAMSGAASDFALQLQSQRQGLQQQAIKDLMGLSGDLLNQRPYDKFLVEKQQKQKQGIDWGGIAQKAIPAALGFALGGPPGAATATTAATASRTLFT